MPPISDNRVTDRSADRRLAVDIGGTFTDVALEVGGSYVTVKTPTTPADPVVGVLEAIRLVLEKAELSPGEIRAVIHGTTLATNALIERKGATVGVIASAGFRDVLEIGYERRYDQYDIFMDKPDMLVPRNRCYTVSERVDARGRVLRPLDEDEVEPLLAALERDKVESVAIGLLHSYANGEHERRLRELLHARQPDLWISLSSEVSPEIREYDRFCTTVANAYVMPRMARYLRDLEQALLDHGFSCPLFMITSGGGMTTVETAIRFPIRLVESGPSGGAILAAKIARQCGLDEIVSFDMGGTTAKVCLIDNGEPQTSRLLEIARAARFIRGSGLPIRIPVIEMIEIGAGGGSIAAIDDLGRIAVGPQSAGADPGPASYDRGGTHATVTDADAVLGYLDPEAFAEGRLRLNVGNARAAVERDVGKALELPAEPAAYGVAEIVDENMANAARVHAVERGSDLRTRTLIAFGGNGPLHASRLAEKVGISRIVVPPDPGVGSAVGFLSAPVAYEVVRSLYMLVSQFDFDAVNLLFAAMEGEADAIVRAGEPETPIERRRTAFMRYLGQGHEIEVPVAGGEITLRDLAELQERYEARYAELYGRHVPRMEIEIMNWAVVVSTLPRAPEPLAAVSGAGTPVPTAARSVYFGRTGDMAEVPCFERAALERGDRILGPALIMEPQTTTFVAPSFAATVDSGLNIVLTRNGPTGGGQG